MKIYALIPARGGSKRIPKKNTRIFCGKPLIVWTIEQAKRSSFVEKIYVSTDDSDTASIAKENGAEVIIRPHDLSKDNTPDLAVFEHFLESLKTKEKNLPDIVAHLRIPNPLRKPEDIDKGVKLLIENPGYDSVRAVIPTPLHPLKTYKLEGKSLLAYISEKESGIEEAFNMPVQSLPKAHAAVGYFSAIRSKTILDKRSMTGKMLGYEVDPRYSVDIDIPSEFISAEVRMREILKESE